MSVFAIEGERIGTFDGTAGDQRSEMAGKAELYISDAYIDRDTGDPAIELTARVRKPVDDVRVRLRLPEHGVQHLIEVLERKLATLE